MHHLLQVWFEWVLKGGYWGIILLMAIELMLLAVNIIIVWYLYKNRERLFRHHHH